MVVGGGTTVVLEDCLFSDNVCGKKVGVLGERCRTRSFCQQGASPTGGRKKTARKSAGVVKSTSYPCRVSCGMVGVQLRPPPVPFASPPC